MLIDTSRAEVIPLGHPLTPDIPTFPDTQRFSLVPNYRHGDYKFDNGYSEFNEVLIMSGHSGTHLDAPGHISDHGRVFGGYSIDEAQDGPRGLVHGSISEVAPIVAAGVIVDVAAARGVDALGPTDRIGVADLVAFEQRSGRTIAAGDCVLLRTGWGAFWHQPETYLGERDGVPGLELEGAVWLAERDVRLVGSDTFCVEVLAAGDLDLPVHMELLARRGILLLENMDLDRIATTTGEFVFVCSPLDIPGAGGSPVRPFALVPGAPA
ncbi:MAG TPA: cyclase family protein [Pseudolysinimonas sp.]|jgi:kynurenine formamidase